MPNYHNKLSSFMKVCQYFESFERNAEFLDNKHKVNTIVLALSSTCSTLT